MKSPKIAIVCDWLTNMGGGEKVVLAMHEAFPTAPIFTSVFNPENMPLFKTLDVRTSFLQKMPGALRKFHKLFPTLRVLAFRKLDLSEYDIILSSSSAEAKQVRKTRKEQIHICYCHTPIRYYWSHYEEYKKNPSFGKLNFLVRLLMPIMVPPMKKADFKAAQKVDLFLANSNEVKTRIKKYYKKDALVLHPPVDVGEFKIAKKHENYFVAIGRQIPYKRFDLAIEACNELGVSLKLFGNGPSRTVLEKIAGDKTEFFDGKNRAKIVDVLSKSRGLIFPAEEDFGLVSVEALAAGVPVIGFKKGGTLDIVQDGENGIFFKKQTTSEVKNAIKKCQMAQFNAKKLRSFAKKFDKTVFIAKLRKIIKDYA
jgi:glycosyltransferase involved in cell wall biosynthesis